MRQANWKARHIPFDHIYDMVYGIFTLQKVSKYMNKIIINLKNAI